MGTEDSFTWGDRNMMFIQDSFEVGFGASKIGCPLAAALEEQPLSVSEVSALPCSFCSDCKFSFPKEREVINITILVEFCL